MAALLSPLLACLLAAADATSVVDADATIRYLLSCQKRNGAFGPATQEHADLAWNYPAVHALLLLEVEIPRAQDCLKNGQWAAFREPDAHRTNLHWDLYQKVHLQRLLVPTIPGGRIAVFPDQRKNNKLIPLGKQWSLRYVDRKGTYYGPYGLGVFYDVASLWYMVSALTGVDGTIANPEMAREFLTARQADNGAFVDAYRLQPAPRGGDAHLITTSQAVMTLNVLNLPPPQATRCAAWIRSCQTPTGGFRWSPTRTDHSNKPDVWYTWAAVRALATLGSRPDDCDGCIRWLNTLQNADGGFGDRPGWNSRLYSTYYAIHALKILCGNARSAIKRKSVPVQARAIAENTYSIFQAHLKAPALADGSQAQMVEAVHAMKLHLVGAKTADVSHARAHAQSKGYTLEVVACPENYPHRLQRLGGHPADHISNWIIPPRMSPQEKAAWSTADQAGRRGLPWPQFKEQVIRPAHAQGSIFYPELDHSMLTAYMLYDDGLDGQPGFSAFLAALGWPAWDWVRHFPYRERWVGKLPALADGDAHGDIATWRDRLMKQRVLYIAKKHTLPHFIRSLREGRSVCVIRDDRTSSGVVYYGSPAAVAYVRKHRNQWQWW